MARKIAVFLGIMLFGTVALADEVTLRPDHPQAYTVVKGDTLWDIAGRFLARPWQWPDIWEVNPQIANPNLIYPGDVIALTYKDGRPVLGLVADRNVKLSPTIRESRHDDRVQPIPLDAVEPFLSRPRVVSSSELENAAYIVGSQDEHLAYGNGHRIYARGLAQAAANKFSIYREGHAYVDPDSGETLGYEAEHVGDARVERFGDPATLIITRAYKEILKGDRLVAEEEIEVPEFVPHAPAAAVDGKILSIVDGLRQVSQYQVVVLNRGASDGLEAGHVLAVYQKGDVVKDVVGSDIADREAREANLRAAQENPSAVGRMFQTMVNDVQAADRALRDFVGTPKEGSSAVTVRLPDERAGEVMVFRTFDRVSYALVMRMNRSIYVHDGVRNP
ncbi:MAG: LysM peptidoglycan-binding domain-containing protein [Gammaproteobacteria bacterium]|nr:LysM peptidoglycan-binding domain-containing protein [Gammaproteobacteria bacterium]MCP5199280.1 LysM peptidoglycan-binding domain-containing protein [Gammaproteobacteria bacterium]